MSPELAERIASLVEQVTGLTFSHSMRDTFPSSRKISIGAEAAAAWKSSRRFRISNAHTHVEHIQLSAGVMPRRTDTAREHYGYVTLAFSAGAPAAIAVADNLDRLVSECEGTYARADAPMWGTEVANAEAFGTMDLPVAPGWILSERIGWTTFLPRCVSEEAGPDARQALALLGAQITTVERGAMLRLAEKPIDDSKPADLGLYRAVRKVLRDYVAFRAGSLPARP